MFQRVLGGFLKKVRLFMPFSTRWNESPLDTVESAAEFVGSRAAFVAQTTLYGYVRTRAGTRYSKLFDEDLFVKSLNISKWRVFLACTRDLAAFLAAKACLGHDRETERELAGLLFDAALGAYDEPEEAGPDWAEAVRETRAKMLTSEIDPDDVEAAFARSCEALVHWAPIADELKELDEEIVLNSIRFKWKEVRTKLASLLDGDALLADLRGEVPSGAD